MEIYAFAMTFAFAFALFYISWLKIDIRYYKAMLQNSVEYSRILNSALQKSDADPLIKVASAMYLK